MIITTSSGQEPRPFVVREIERKHVSKERRLAASHKIQNDILTATDKFHSTGSEIH